MRRIGPFHVLLALSAVLIVAGLVYSVRAARLDWGDDPRQDEETGRAMAEADRAAGRAHGEFRARRFQDAAAAARAELDPARSLLASCENRARTDPLAPDLQQDLVRAALKFGRYIELHPQDVEVLLLRARAWELRRFGDKAAADLKRAIELRPELADPLAGRLRAAQAGYP